MHQSSMKLMETLVAKYASNITHNVLDVGAYNVNGCYRNMCETKGLLYEGMDIAAGPNVDIVSETNYRWPIDDDTYDMVISGQCMEHVPMPWKWIKELVRVCRPGGIVIVICPGLNWGIHRHPTDCWRVLPDGMRTLLGEWAGLRICEVGICGPPVKKNCDCYGVGLKPITD